MRWHNGHHREKALVGQCFELHRLTFVQLPDCQHLGASSWSVSGSQHGSAEDCV